MTGRPGRPRAENGGHAGQPAQSQSADPAAVSWPSQFAQVLAETLAGSRPPEQIIPWTTEQARKKIGELGPLLATAHRPRVRRVIVTSPAAGVLEMTVIVVAGGRVRALAVRLEHAAPTAPGDPRGPAQASDAGGTANPGRAANPGCTANPGKPAEPGGTASPGKPAKPSNTASPGNTAHLDGAASPGSAASPGDDANPGDAAGSRQLVTRGDHADPSRAGMPGRRHKEPSRWLCTAVEAA